MSDSENADSLSTMSNLFTAMDLIWSATIDKLSGLEIGTTATTSYGAAAAGFGLAEQYAIWESSDKELSDLERFSVGLGSNLPGIPGFFFIPKKLFDDNFDQGENEAENLAKLIKLSNFLRDLLGFDDGRSSIAEPSLVREDMKTRFSQAQAITSPLILDLDGDGVETTSLADGVFFDHDGNGFAEKSGWVGGDDGLLVLDRNGNGTIDGGRELFGSNTLLADGATAANGFAALAELDENGDGKIDAQDTAWGEVRVWRDTNLNGVTDAGELATLTDAGIRHLDIEYGDSSYIDAYGNAHKQVGSFTRSDGSAAAMTDVWFAADYADTKDKNIVPVTEEIAALPDIAGTGNVASLHQVMAVDATGRLEEKLLELMSEPDEGHRRGLAVDVVLLWAGTDTVDPDSRGSYVDGRQLAALERFLGQDYYQPGWGANPGSTAGKMLSETFGDFVDNIFARLDAQTHFSSLYSQVRLDWDGQTGTPRLDFAAVAVAIGSEIAADRAAGLTLLDRFARNMNSLGYTADVAWHGFSEQLSELSPEVAETLRLAQLETHSGTSGADDMAGSSADERLVGFAGDDTLDGRAGDDVIEGGAGADRLLGYTGNDRLFGGEGNDDLAGGSGDDWLAGGAGDDALNAGTGNDVYAFERGFGADTIRQYDATTGRVDVARFADLAAADVSDLLRSGDDLSLVFASGDRLIVSGYFDSAARRVDFEFSGAERWDYIAVKNRTTTNGTDAADTLYGYSGAPNTVLGLGGDDKLCGSDRTDWLSGGLGDDTLYGYSGDDELLGNGGGDILKGGAGNDRLIGGADDDLLDGGSGDDVYEIGLADGWDTIVQYDSAGTDTIRFGAGVAYEQLWFSRTDDDLDIRVIGGEAGVRVDDWYVSDPHRVDRIETSDGHALLETQVQALVDAMAAFAPPAAGQTTLPPDCQTAVQPIIAANWQ